MSSAQVIGHDLVRHGKLQKKASEVIHRADCPRIRGRDMMPWIWAEGRPVSEWLDLGWFTGCTYCRPDEERTNGS